MRANLKAVNEAFSGSEVVDKIERVGTSYLFNFTMKDGTVHTAKTGGTDQIFKSLNKLGEEKYLKSIGIKFGAVLSMRKQKPQTQSHPVVELVESEPEQEFRPIQFGKVKSEYNGYYFPSSIKNICSRIEHGRNIFLSGPAGCGKTQMIMKLADMVETKCVRINFHTGTNEGQLIGKFTVRGGETHFNYGLIPLAMKNGWWILLDEIDYAEPEHLAVLQPVLEGNPLIMIQNENEEIKPHPNFRIFASANTKGRGDETQSYTGTNALNLAFVDRWSVVEVDYNLKAEKKIVGKLLNDDVLEEQVLKYFKLLRDSTEKGEIMNAAFSTRRLEQFCEALAWKESLKDALEFEILSRFNKEESDQIREYGYDVWDRDFYFKGWNLGDKHKP